MFTILSKTARVAAGLLFVGALVGIAEHRARACTAVPGCHIWRSSDANGWCSNVSTKVKWTSVSDVTLSGTSAYWSYQCGSYANDLASRVIAVAGPTTDVNRGVHPYYSKSDPCPSHLPVIWLVNCGGGQQGYPLCNTREAWVGDDCYDQPR